MLQAEAWEGGGGLKLNITFEVRICGAIRPLPPYLLH